MLFRLPHLGLDCEWWRTVSKAAAPHCESWRFSLFPSVPAKGNCCNCSAAATDPACSQCSFPYCAYFSQHHNSDSSFLWWWRLLIFLLLKKQSLNLIRLGGVALLIYKNKYFCGVFSIPLRTRATGIPATCFIDYGCLGTTFSLRFFLFRPWTVSRQI